MPHRSSPMLSVEHTQVCSGINRQMSCVMFCDQSEWQAERRGGAQAATHLNLVFLELNPGALETYRSKGPNFGFLRK